MPDTDTAKESAQAPCADAGLRRFSQPFSAMPDRLDKVLARLLPEHSRSRLQEWIEAGHVRVNGEPGRIKQRVNPGDRLEVHLQVPAEDLAFAPEPVEFPVVAQSPDWIVVDKPAGLVTHPGAGNWSGTLLNGLLHRFPELSRVARAGIVHRLDKDTSGLLVVARHDVAQTHLVRQLQARTVSREYHALVHGHLRKAGRLSLDIGRDRFVPVRMSVDRPVSAKPAVTHYEPVRRGMLDDQPVTEVVCRLETGRTHQIRVHMASLKHPLVGDVLYGGRMPAGVVCQLLHARALSFDDPATRERVSFQAALPDDIVAVEDRVAWLTS